MLPASIVVATKLLLRDMGNEIQNNAKIDYLSVKILEIIAELPCLRDIQQCYKNCSKWSESYNHNTQSEVVSTSIRCTLFPQFYSKHTLEIGILFQKYHYVFYSRMWMLSLRFQLTARNQQFFGSNHKSKRFLESSYGPN